MYGLPRSTELNRQLPKKLIFDKFKLNAQERAKFDADIRKLTIAAEVSPTTVNIAAGESVSAFYVIQVILRREEYDPKIVITLSKLIDQNMLFVLEYEDKVRLAVYRARRVLESGSKLIGECTLTLSGLDLDAVWENIIAEVGGIDLEGGKDLDETIVINEQREKLNKQIAALEKKAMNERQPRRKWELVVEIKRLKEGLERL